MGPRPTIKKLFFIMQENSITSARLPKDACRIFPGGN